MPTTAENPEALRVATFYRFTRLPEFAMLRTQLEACCRRNGLRGTILLAGEGVNGTIGGTLAGIGAVMSALRAVPGLEDIEPRVSPCGELPFRRMKVRLREEIVTLGAHHVDPTGMTGIHVPPGEWNALVRRDDVVLIDARNDYEVEIGSFEGARNPATASFGELPAWIDAQADLASRPPVAMFCTGGIRCEKATAYLRSRGFGEVYQLEGGILNYLDTVPEQDSLWRGECFVFDERVALRHGLAPGTHRLCAGCGRPVREDAAACDRCLRSRES